jgi:HK97 family phage major capsid protein
MGIDELLQKAVDTTELAAGGLLGTEQSRKFTDLVVDQSVMLREARVVRMRSAVAELDKIATTGRVSQLKREGIAPSTMSDPHFDKVILTAVDVITPFEITFEALEDSIAGGGLEDAVIRAMAKQTATDLEELAIHGDPECEDPFLTGLSGWRLLAESGHFIDLKGETLDKAGLSQMFRALPDKYKRNWGDLRFYTAPAVAQDWHDTFADRGTAAGDAALLGGQVPPYMGVPIVTVPAIPTDLDGIVGQSGSDMSYCFLTPRENLIFGIHREIRVDKDKDILRGVNIYAITTRVAVEFEEDDAVVLAVNVGKS